MRAYLTVWRRPSAPVLLLSGFAGRLPSAMVPLALLLMVQQSTGSYAVAGLASAERPALTLRTSASHRGAAVGSGL